MRRLVPGALLLALLLSACTGGQMTLAQLRRVPGATTAYPGSTFYQRWGQEAEANAMAKNPASLKTNACANASRRQLIAYFARTLHAHGWTTGYGMSDTGSFEREDHSMEWKRGQLTFQLWFLKPAYADRLARAAGKPTGCASAYQTIVS